ncbi:MAG: hypothetical protein JWM54_466 [Acidobacteriaceae bacterium]|jgi:hypothetical protein|nr:hypothetical protein [Acidobacteriaceae bacterium]
MSLPNVTKTADGPGRTLALVENRNPSATQSASPVPVIREERFASNPALGMAYELQDERLPSVSSF